MKILFLDAPVFAKQDMIAAWKKQGAEVELWYEEACCDRENEAFDRRWKEKLQSAAYDAVFSFNYFPSLSRGCQACKVLYFSYVYDSPHVALYSKTVVNPVNHIFVFDRQMAVKLQQRGIKTVYYLPLAVNVERLDEITLSEEQKKQLASDVSFVGSMYDETHDFYSRLGKLPAYWKGYFDAVSEAQMKVQGYSFLEQALSKEALQQLQQCLPYQTQPDGMEDASYFYSQYVLARHVTSLERRRLLASVAKKAQVKLYTHQKPEDIPGVTYIGPIDWEESAPAVFRCSKINLNISLRSIESGIPLRAFEIMGAGGFLLTNYQADFLDYFTPGQDYVYYESEQDLVDKTVYYLTHEEERVAIAQNGYQKVKQFHSFSDRLALMLEVAGISEK